MYVTIVEFSVNVSKNVSISGNLQCVFKFSVRDGQRFPLNVLIKLKIKIPQSGHLAIILDGAKYDIRNFSDCAACYPLSLKIEEDNTVRKLKPK